MSANFGNSSNTGKPDKLVHGVEEYGESILCIIIKELLLGFYGCIEIVVPKHQPANDERKNEMGIIGYQPVPNSRTDALSTP